MIKWFLPYNLLEGWMYLSWVWKCFSIITRHTKGMQVMVFITCTSPYKCTIMNYCIVESLAKGPETNDICLNFQQLFDEPPVSVCLQCSSIETKTYFDVVAMNSQQSEYKAHHKCKIIIIITINYFWHVLKKKSKN